MEMATAKGRPACTQGKVGWVLVCHGGCNRPVLSKGRCPAPLKIKGKKRGNNLSEAFLGALGTVRAMVVGWLVCPQHM